MAARQDELVLLEIPVCPDLVGPELRYWFRTLEEIGPSTVPASLRTALWAAAINLRHGYSRERTPKLAVSRRHVRRILRDNLLPRPVSFRAWGRCIQTFDHLQQSAVSIDVAALETGWPETASFYRSCRKLAGERPSNLRNLDHRELLHRLMRHHGKQRRDVPG